jgi:N-acetylneuraminate synthase/N,N'-diacetyllegionaminate synthase
MGRIVGRGTGNVRPRAALADAPPRAEPGPEGIEHGYDAAMAGPAMAFHSADATRQPRVLIVAELGVNHDGDAEQAMAMIEAAANARADAIKLQYFRAERLLSSEARLAGYQAATSDDPYHMLAARELSFETMQRLRAAAHERDLGFIVTPFSGLDVEELATLGVEAVKVASPDAVNTPLVGAAATLNVPLLISTGTCGLDDLKPAATQLRAHAAGGALLQCVSSYPTPPEQAALGGMAALREAFTVAVGYSDHTAAEHTGALAVASGACVLEKHLTLDRAAKGPDHAASLDPTQFARYVEQARQAAVMLGPRCKAPLEIETDVAQVSRQSVCAARPLSTGRVLQPDDLTIKRPGTAIPAHDLETVIGRTLSRPVQANQLLRWGDLA